jgi:hypothetical protein
VGLAAPTPFSPRPSIADRERVARRLRGACKDARLSLDTFAARIDLVYSVRTGAELRELVADVTEDHPVNRAVFAAVASVSSWTSRVAAAWRQPRTPRLVLPLRGSVLLGRSRECDCVLADATVSAKHAALHYAEGSWWLRDLASTNGTFVNGWRVIGEVELRDGDEVTFGGTSYRIATAPKPTTRLHRLASTRSA